jgi:hypothetical protein
MKVQCALLESGERGFRSITFVPVDLKLILRLVSVPVLNLKIYAKDIRTNYSLQPILILEKLVSVYYPFFCKNQY